MTRPGVPVRRMRPNHAFERTAASALRLLAVPSLLRRLAAAQRERYKDDFLEGTIRELLDIGTNSMGGSKVHKSESAGYRRCERDRHGKKNRVGKAESGN